MFFFPFSKFIDIKRCFVDVLLRNGSKFPSILKIILYDQMVIRVTHRINDVKLIPHSYFISLIRETIRETPRDAFYSLFFEYLFRCFVRTCDISRIVVFMLEFYITGIKDPPDVGDRFVYCLFIKNFTHDVV